MEEEEGVKDEEKGEEKESGWWSSSHSFPHVYRSRCSSTEDSRCYQRGFLVAKPEAPPHPHTLNAYQGKAVRRGHGKGTAACVSKETKPLVEPERPK